MNVSKYSIDHTKYIIIDRESDERATDLFVNGNFSVLICLQLLLVKLFVKLNRQIVLGKVQVYLVFQDGVLCVHRFSMKCLCHVHEHVTLFT
jgi:hypothetical protein